MPKFGHCTWNCPRNGQVICNYKWSNILKNYKLCIIKLQTFEWVTGPKSDKIEKIIYSSLSLPLKEWIQGRTKLSEGQLFTFHDRQDSFLQSEARQSWRSRKRKSWPEESFVIPRIQFLSGVRWGDTFFHSRGVSSTKRSKNSTPCKLSIKYTNKA